MPIVSGTNGNKEVINVLSSGDERVSVEYEMFLSLVDFGRTKIAEPNHMIYGRSPEAIDGQLNATIEPKTEWKDTIPFEEFLSLNETTRTHFDKNVCSIEAAHIRKNQDREVLTNETSLIALFGDADFEADSFYFVRDQSGTYKIKSNERSKRYHIEDESYAQIVSHLYDAGNGTNLPCIKILPHFPIRDVVVYSVTDPDAIKWTEINSLAEAVETDLVYEVDYYNGLIKFGGTVPDYQLILSANITDTDTTITLHPSINNLKLPVMGIVSIGSEYIRYRNKSGDQLLYCERGYQATVAAAHTAHDLISIVRNGYPPEDTETIYIGYSNDLFVKQEVEGIRHKNLDSFQDVNKVMVVSNNYSVLDDILVESDLTEYEENAFGIYRALSNSAPSYLMLTAVDNQGNPLSDISLEITSTHLYFDGDSLSKTKISNANGKAKFTLEIEDSSVFSTKYGSIVHNAGNTDFAFDSIPFQTENDFLLYQIVKDDNNAGSLGQTFNVSNAGNDHIIVIGTNTFRNEEVVFRALIDSVLFTGTGHLQNDRIVLDQDDLASMLSLLAINTKLATDPVTIRVTGVDELEWDPITLNGTSLLLATQDGGSYVPVRPAYVDSTVAVYQGLLVEPEPEELYSNLGGYALVGPRAFTATIVGTQRSTGIQVTKEVTIYSKLADRVSANETGSLLLVNESFNRTGLSPANYVSINPIAQFRLSMRIS
jgi:hypothetical protein